MTDADVTAATRPDDARESEVPSEETVVTAHSSCPGRTVLTERGNTDAWIASNLTVGLSR